MLLSPVLLAEIAGAAGLTGAAAWLLYQLFYVPVPPNKALILFGRRARPAADARDPASRDVVARAPRVLIGGGTVLAPWNKAFAYLSLAPIDVEATVRAVHSVEGGSAAGWEVTLAVQAKVPAEPEALRAAAENLFGMSSTELGSFVRRAVEASVPLVLARLAVGDAEPDWDRLGSEIQATVAPELIPSGLIVRSVAVRELHRIAQPSTGSGPGAERLRAAPALPTAPRGTGEVDQRLNRIERGLQVMGAQVDRWMRDRRSDDDGFPLYEPALGPASSGGEDPLYVPTQDGRPARPRPSLATGRARDAGGPPTASDEEIPR